MNSRFGMDVFAASDVDLAQALHSMLPYLGNPVGLTDHHEFHPPCKAGHLTFEAVMTHAGSDLHVEDLSEDIR